jgi:hypothetical protein
MTRRKQAETEHAEPAVTVGGKRFRGAGAPTTGLTRGPKREPGYIVPAEIIVPRQLVLRPMAPCPYGED